MSIKQVKYLLPLTLLALGLANIIISYCAGHPFRSGLFEADILYLPTLFSDIFSHEGKISDWYLTPAPYFFPDYPLFFVSYILGLDSYDRIAIFSVTQTSACFLTIWLLTRHTLKPNSLPQASTATIGLIWLALSTGNPFTLVLASACHFGTYISSLLLAALWIRYKFSTEKKHALQLRIAMCALAFIAALSDNLFLPQAIAPIVATSLFFDLQDKNSTTEADRFYLLLAAFGAMGSASYKFIIPNHTRYPTVIGIENAQKHLADIYIIFQKLIQDNPVYGAVLAIYVVLLIRHLRLAFRSKADQRPPKPLTWLVLFSFFAICSTVAATCLATNLPMASRYLMPALLWPVLISTMLVAHQMGTRFFAAATIGSALTVAALSIDSYKIASQHRISTTYYPAEIACIDALIDQEDLHNGIAQYWDAKPLQQFSRRDLIIAQHSENLNEERWITSKKYFRNYYDFAVISENLPAPYRISTAAISKINGIPHKTRHCGGKTVYIYGKNKLRTRKIIDVGDAYLWKACELPTILGKRGPACELSQENAPKSGYITFGPHEPLIAGQYQFDIAYASAEPRTQDAGTWDVVIDLPNGKTKLLRKGPIKGSAGKTETITDRFILNADSDVQKIEVRALVHRKRTLRIIHLQIKRLA